MAENDNINILGKKIFFLHPSTIVQNQVIMELAQEEFEVYTVKEEKKLNKVLKKYPDSIVFASINEGMREKAWEEWITGIMSSAETSGVSISIIASGVNDATKRKYLLQFKNLCGYTVMKSDINEVIKQIIKILTGIDAKGRRKFIRAVTDSELNTTVNFPVNGTFMNGKIKDISAIGFSCSFEEDPGLVKNSLFSDIQIRLQSHLFKAEGIVFGSRMNAGEKVYVVLFTQRINPEVRTKIRKFIQNNLQNKMDLELDS